MLSTFLVPADGFCDVLNTVALGGLINIGRLCGLGGSNEVGWTAVGEEVLFRDAPRPTSGMSFPIP